MKRTKQIHDRYLAIKTHINDIEAMLKTKERQPAGAFRHDSDVAQNEVEIDELRGFLDAYLKVQVQYQSIYEID